MNEPTVTEQILDLLLDALQERQQQRQQVQEATREDADFSSGNEPVPEPKPPVAAAVPEAAASSAAAPLPDEEKPVWDEVMTEDENDMPETAVLDESPLSKPDGLPSLPPPDNAQLARMLARLSLGILLVLAVINMPFNRYGTSLARAMPDTAALIVRDGLLLKGTGPEVYVLEDNRLRWVSSLDAFEQYGYRWENVHEVDATYLARFAMGRPIHLLLKCEASPHIYAFEDGKKRWIKDIPTFEAEGYMWEDVNFVSCSYLRNLPDGTPIPTDAGPSPQP